MKVTICCHDGRDYFGGPNEWLKRFIVQLRAYGCKVNVLFYLDHPPAVCPTYQFVKNNNFTCSYLISSSRTQYHDNTEDRVKWFLKEVKKNTPDVYIGHNMYESIMAGRWIKEAGIPTIMVMHSIDPQHDFFYTEFVEGLKEFTPSGAVVVSPMVREGFEKRNIYNIPVRSIPCGVPIPEQKAKIGDEGIKLMYLGKLSDYAKRITDITSVLCKTSLIIEKYSAAIYGDGPEKPTVLKIISDNTNDKVQYKGFVKNEEVYEHLIKNNVFVLLSDFEGTPVALMEAMAAGLVPICSDIKSGIPDLVQHMETGLIVKDRDQSFIDAVLLLSQDHDLWKRLSEKAIKKIEADFSIQSTTRAWIDFMEKLVNETEKRNLVIPAVIKLPPYKPELVMIDRRKKNIPQYLQSQVTRVLSLVKRFV